LGLAAALLGAGACGKKGPPLAPLIPIPAAIDQISATRVGDEAYVTLTVPSANIDQFAPANINRIEVYGYTGRTPPPRTRWVEFGTLVATLPVAPPIAPAPPPEKQPTAEPSRPAAPAPLIRAPRQGAQVTIVDTLSPEELVQGRELAPDPKLSVISQTPSTGSPLAAAGSPGVGSPTPDPRTQTAGTPTPGSRTPGSPIPDPRSPNQTPNPNPNAEPGPRNVELPPLRRFYTAIPWSPRGRPGPPGANAEFPLYPVPEAPTAVNVLYDASEVRVTWEPSGGVVGFLLERPLPEEELPLELEELAAAQPTVPPGPVLYNVYRSTSPDPFAPPPDAPANDEWNRRPPTPLNPVPLSAFEFSDAVAFNEERCYTVRPVRGVPPDLRVGMPSAPACVTAVDTFPPDPPAGLATVAAEGAINLIWEPSGEPDLGGYVVLRGEAPGDTLQPLTTAPITEASYRDAAVTPGTRYVYAVVAMDNRFPVPNLSAESERVEETAR
jgi:hypothetical protein